MEVTCKTAVADGRDRNRGLSSHLPISLYAAWRASNGVYEGLERPRDRVSSSMQPIRCSPHAGHPRQKLRANSVPHSQTAAPEPDTRLPDNSNDRDTEEVKCIRKKTTLPVRKDEFQSEQKFMLDKSRKA